MTSFLDIDAMNDRESGLAARQAAVLAKQRADSMFGAFVSKTGKAGLQYVTEDLQGISIVAAEEVGYDQPEKTFSTVMDYFQARLDEWDREGGIVVGDRRTAAVEAARKPKMCPFHKDVVDISLADGNPRSGFEALRDHWGGPRHCQGDGYEGDKCNFKPQMTTQTFWDEKAEKAEQRRKDRAEQEAPEVLEVDEAELEPVEEPTATEPIETDQDDGAEIIDFPVPDAAEAPETDSEVPMSMAASTKTAMGYLGPDFATRHYMLDQINQQHPGLTVNGGPLGDWDELHQRMQSGSGPEIEFGHPNPQIAERLQHTFGEPNRGYTPEEYQERWRSYRPPIASSTKVADGGPIPVMDKRKWTPQTVPFLDDVDDDDGPHPTRHKDIVEPIKPENRDKLTEIGESVTEHQDVEKDSGPGPGAGTQTWTEGPKNAVSSTIPADVDKNPITALIQGEYDGFVPHAAVEAAIRKHRTTRS